MRAIPENNNAYFSLILLFFQNVLPEMMCKSFIKSEIRLVIVVNYILRLCVSKMVHDTCHNLKFFQEL